MILNFGAGPLTTVLTDTEAAQQDYNPEESYTPVSQPEELGLDLRTPAQVAADAARAQPGAPLAPLFTASPLTAPWAGSAPLVQASPGAAPQPGATVASSATKLPALALAAGALGLFILWRK